jgi:hypothetical protein
LFQGKGSEPNVVERLKAGIDIRPGSIPESIPGSIRRLPAGEQARQVEASRHRLDNQPYAVALDDGLIGIQLEIARDAQGLVTPITKETDLTF